jgi:ribose 5-phosphate isomerase B
MGTNSAEPVDFPDITEKVGRAVQNADAERGILVCGSGVGACIAANKMKGVYASICHDTYSAAQGVRHDDMNVLCLGGRVIGSELAIALVNAFLDAHYIGNEAGGERLARRVAKIHKIEDEVME